jgi:hypothetical protein
MRLQERTTPHPPDHPNPSFAAFYRFVFVTKDGMIYERELSLEPVWMQRKPEDPKAATVMGWKGLLEGEHAPAALSVHCSGSTCAIVANRTNRPAISRR